MQKRAKMHFHCPEKAQKLLKPACNVVLGPEEVDDEADPAGGKNYYTADYFAHKRDGLLDDVDDCQD